MVAAIVANAHRDSKQQPEPFTPWDFVLPTADAEAIEAREEAEREQRLERMKAKAQEIAARFRAKQERQQAKAQQTGTEPTPRD